ncbi:MAG: UvrD-helicase domain-containing protein [Prevotella sp.]|nr:UvrD-helicase domain-containing protein [Prevotella sp.]
MEEKRFNEAQRRVIRATGGHHLVLAPPGCGKTAVLAERIVYAREQGIAFGEMACLTFTNRAARSMCERIQQRMGDEYAASLDELFVGNVHRFCLHFLFDSGSVPEHSAVVDADTSLSILADFMDDDELKVLADNRSRQRYSQIINLQHLMYQMQKGYPNDLIVHGDAVNAQAMRELCNTFHLTYNRAGVLQLYQQADSYRDELAEMGRNGMPALSSDARLLLQMLYAANSYQRYKRQNDLLDFEDLLLFTYDVLSVEPSQHRFRWLQIDEVQDLNPLQLAIVDLFATPDATIVYLGDSQQAIFSFMGAKTDTLDMLRQRCGDHFYNFYQNYRSPQYLLDIFNSYAQRQLKIHPSLLPTTHNQKPSVPGDVQLLEAATNIDEANLVAACVAQLYAQHPEETIAVVVAFNSDADDVSSALRQLPHFKISGSDFFATPPMRLLLSHLGVVHMEHDFISWSNILSGLQVYASNSAARQVVHAMLQLAISPADVLLYEGETYVTRFIDAYEQRDIVVFDTETTGLDVFQDDVVQIAAIRVSKGKVVDSLNLFLETSRAVPPMLGDISNPLVEEYQQQPHLSPAQGLQRFVDFASGCAILGHNTTYDYQIMEHNMQRYAPQLSMYELWPDYLDTLKLARLLHPRQKSYKLRDLLVQLQLEGTNSHLADDDIMATLSLMVHCYDCARSVAGRQRAFLSSHSSKMQRFRLLYADLYRHACEQKYVAHTVPSEPSPSVAQTAQPASSPVTQALQDAYRQLLDARVIPVLPKLDFFIRYIEGELSEPASCSSLATQLSRHYSDLCTMKEADMCGSSSITERVFVSTVHKAKGLEFDTVIVYDAVDGKYPSSYATDASKQEEEARKFYVAISRARRRLIVSYCHNVVTRYGSWYSKVLTPYMRPIANYFR